MTMRMGTGGATPEDVLAVAEGLYRDAAVELYRVIEAIRAGEMAEIKAAQVAIRDLRATALHVLDERGKVDKLRKQIAGQVGAGGALDFDGARVEIGRRLIGCVCPGQARALQSASFGAGCGWGGR